jgi:hypothetical protein
LDWKHPKGGLLQPLPASFKVQAIPEPLAAITNPDRCCGFCAPGFFLEIYRIKNSGGGLLFDYISGHFTF